MITGFKQIGIVVDDVDSSVKKYTEEYGIGPWEVIRFGKELFPELLINGKAGELELKCAFCKVNGFEIELIEPISESIFSEFLEENGPGIHHVAIESGRGFQDILEMVRDKGEKPLIHVQKPDGTDLFACLDLMKELGFCVEIYGDDEKRESS